MPCGLVLPSETSSQCNFTECLTAASLLGGEGKDKERIWQPYADFLVSAVLMALPWGGAELAEGAPAELQKLTADVEKYMELRPSTHTAALRPFLKGDDPASTSDSGAASFLGQVCEICFHSCFQSHTPALSWKPFKTVHCSLITKAAASPYC